MQNWDDARRQPGIDWIAHLRLRDRNRRHDVERTGRGFAVTGSLAHRALEQPGQICTMPAEGETGKLQANPADHAARRLATFERLWIKRSIASREPTPAYHARSADRDAVSGKDSGGGTFGIRRL